MELLNLFLTDIRDERDIVTSNMDHIIMTDIFNAASSLKKKLEHYTYRCIIDFITAV